ncbi:ABC transporter permease [Pseudorhodoferax sp. Leaf274]|uniref:ABC transporter permease n=1 Tax=Pseudorhodoferax sp. Leaf274 TaxID=1736318 RepID=UPI0007029263|nr:ABC transporter permease [Pseudorhodoferax sp. Leaf274]KQP44678.1 ABC transporter permease [Pseudorhodoferax sp. Leaf274]
MAQYILRRLVQAFFTVFLVVALIFTVVRAIGDPTHLMLPPEATESDRQVLREQMGLDRPLPQQFASFVGELARGDFGNSYRFSKPALEVVTGALGPTLQLTLAALLVALAIGLPLGVASAVWPGGLLDQFGKIFSVFGQAAPPFFFSLIFVKMFSLQFGWFPTGGYGGLSHMALPMFALGWYAAAGIARLTRSSMAAVLHSEYVKFARIKGVPEHVIVLRHALKNALLPVITFVSLQFGVLMGGAVSVEVVFAWPGVGQLILDSINNLDYTVVQAAVTVSAVVFALVNLAVDLLYAVIDPRIHYG